MQLQQLVVDQPLKHDVGSRAHEEPPPELELVHTWSASQFFTYPGAEVETDSDEDQDIVAMVGPLLDLRPAFRDATLLALPLSPTCRSDCPGLCPQCGFRMADDPEHRHHTSDPRLAALEGLRDKYAQPESEGE